MVDRRFAHAPSASIPDYLDKTIDGGRLRLVKLIGRGSWGAVYLGITSHARPRRYGVKIVHKDLISKDHCKSLPYEVGLHNICSTASPNVVQLLNVLQHEHEDLLFLITEYCPDGDLLQMIQRGKYRFNDELQKSVFLQVIDAVDACHKLNVFHRDLKPENIFCKNDGKTVVLGDFGLATPAEISNGFRAGSMPFMSPEVHGGLQSPLMAYSTRHADVWALGVLLLNLACGRLPWARATMTDPAFRLFLLRDRDYLLHYFPITAELNNLLKKVFTADVEDRISLTDLRDEVVGLTKLTTTTPPPCASKPIVIHHDAEGEQLPAAYGGPAQPELDITHSDGLVQVLRPKRRRDRYVGPGPQDHAQPVFNLRIVRKDKGARPVDEPCVKYAPPHTILVRAPGQPTEIHEVPALSVDNTPTAVDSNPPDLDAGNDSSDSAPDSAGPITPPQHAADAANVDVAEANLEDVPSLEDDIATPAVVVPVQKEAQRPGYSRLKSIRFRKFPAGVDESKLGQPSVERILRNAARMMGMAA